MIIEIYNLNKQLFQMPIFRFFDLDKKLLKEYKKLFNKLPQHIKVQVLTEPVDVRTIKDIDVFVSPANSFGVMDGGIDEIYMEMFQGIQEFIQDEIKQKSFLKFYGKHTLPVGSAFLSRFKNIQIVCAPTMSTPQNIERSPQNVYYAMYAIIKVCEHLSDDTIVGVPGLGTGVGGLSGNESGHEIFKAFTKPPTYPSNIKIKFGQGKYILDQQFLK